MARVTVLGGLCVIASWPASAQQPHMAMQERPGWTITFDAQAFLTGNVQVRKFTDFYQIESQNWGMAAAAHSIRRGTLDLITMISLEPFTERRIGSAQVFQVGETYQGSVLIDYQHPHDLVMAAGVSFGRPVGASRRVMLEADLVGAPALGPMPFMHRPSADVNPTAPLSHHHLDSTHQSHGVLTAGIATGVWTIETSAFHGREPDENRVNVELGPLDSYSARVSWQRGGWNAQLSAGHLKFPDKAEFTDVNRITASVARETTFKGQPLALLLAFGLNREPAFDLSSPAWLLEGVWHAGPRDEWFARAELLDQDILTAGGYDPPGFRHVHVLSLVGALTLGYERTLAAGKAGHLGVGLDASVYRTPPNLADAYGHPFSAHAFLRYRIGQTNPH